MTKRRSGLEVMREGGNQRAVEVKKAMLLVATITFWWSRSWAEESEALQGSTYSCSQVGGQHAPP